MLKNTSNPYIAMANRLHHSFILYCILLISILFYSCSNNENDIITAEDIKVLPIINVDSIFINLDDKASLGISQPIQKKG